MIVAPGRGGLKWPPSSSIVDDTRAVEDRPLSDPTPVLWRTTPPGVAAPPAGRRGPADLVRRHPLVSFFVLAYAVSWLAWLPFVLSADGLGVLGFQYPRLLGTNQLLGVLPGAYLGPLGSAVLVTAVTGGRDGLRRWGRRVLAFRVGWRWYLAALVGVPALLIGCTALMPGAAGDVTAPPVTVLVAYLPVLVFQFVTTGVAEEPGWRDFALPLIQRRHGAALGTLVLGLVWAGWHLPLFLTTWSPGGRRVGTDGWSLALGAFILFAVALSFLVTWVFNHTRESLPLAVLLHTSNNTTASVVLPFVFPHLRDAWTLVAGALGYGLVALVLLAVTRGRLGYRDAASSR